MKLNCCAQQLYFLLLLLCLMLLLLRSRATNDNCNENENENVLNCSDYCENTGNCWTLLHPSCCCCCLVVLLMLTRLCFLLLFSCSALLSLYCVALSLTTSVVIEKALTFGTLICHPQSTTQPWDADWHIDLTPNHVFTIYAKTIKKQVAAMLSDIKIKEI